MKKGFTPKELADQGRIEKDGLVSIADLSKTGEMELRVKPEIVWAYIRNDRYCWPEEVVLHGKLVEKKETKVADKRESAPIAKQDAPEEVETSQPEQPDEPEQEKPTTKRRRKK